MKRALAVFLLVGLIVSACVPGAASTPRSAAGVTRIALAYLESLGLNHAISDMATSWELWRILTAKALNHCLGPDSNNDEGDNASLHLSPEAWIRHTARPYPYLTPRAYLPLARHGSILRTFTATEEDIPNPERGLYHWPVSFDDATLANYAREGRTLVRQREDLRDYLRRDLSPDYLNALATRFQAARRAGLKVILRFTYNHGENYPNPAPDASLPQVLRHIEQLAPVLEANKDVIAWIEAGFIGAWGEWHTSASGLDTPANKAAIREALLAHFPQDRFILFRYPSDFIRWYPQPLTEAEAFSGSPQARTGHHNDCFLASADDMGTYYDYESRRIRAEEWKAYIAQMGRFVPISGETCRPNPPRSNCETALHELNMLHWSAIDDAWHPDVIQSWKDQGCFDEIRRRLGYRLTLRRATFSPEARPGSKWSITVHLQNTGFAAPLLERPVYLLLVAQTQDTTPRPNVLLYNVDVDPRRWEPGYHRFSATLTLPADLPSGDYLLALWLPDPADALRADSRYALRFANENTWDASHGWNVLGSVRVQR